MRETLFRGKRIYTKEWVKGSLVMVQDDETLNIYPNIVISYTHDTFEVIPETVSQFVNLTDKNGKPAFVGNIYKEVMLDGSERLYRIFEVLGGFAINQFQDDFYKKDEDILFYAGLSDPQTASFFQHNLIEIGNIFDNKELLIK